MARRQEPKKAQQKPVENKPMSPFDDPVFQRVVKQVLKAPSTKLEQKQANQ